MPFTFAHPAAVLPFHYLSKRYISMTALVAGSMAPDFEYFLRMKILGLYGHTPGGWLFFDLPLSLILAFLFHLVVRNPLIRHLPAFLSGRLQVYYHFNWTLYFRRHWAAVIISALAGTGTHLLWDSFTHPTGFFVRRIPFLNSLLPGLPIHIYTLLQHGSTVLGFIVIGYALTRLPWQPPSPDGRVNRYFWLVIAGLTVIIFAMRYSLQAISYIGDIVAALVGAGFWALLIVSFFDQRRQRHAIP